ncbi:hypothetical protein EJ02DRAFT_337872 [Clathrospora elynae]|uniref:Uncharacterized protein n=1 Tax=Clathrospora elynae TaxID=706981 RepID=A0A6A5SYQ5_9PLEO|nr:hypothetical protein EJ02DRAFT_337872 [Clathrospora elynae]
MAAGPPLGQPWLANVGNNPNINREPPPPPINAGPAPQVPPPAAAGGQQQFVVEQQHAPIYGPPVPIGIGGPAFGITPPFGVGIGAFPPVFPPFGVGVMDPMMMYGGYGGGGPLAPIRSGNFLPGAHHGIGFGLHGAAGVPFPPPPPGAIAGVVPPFAPAAPLWAGGGLAFGNVPAMGVGGVFGGIIPPMMMGGGMIGMGMDQHHRPAPAFHDGNQGFPDQPEQQEITQIAGGIPPGVTLIESAEHTIFIRVQGNVCPWLSPGAQYVMEPLALASTTGLNRVIMVCNGALPPDELENTAITECIELGNGMWEKGQTFKYNDAVSRVLTMKDAGWDNKRNRTNGQSLHLWGHRI